MVVGTASLEETAREIGFQIGINFVDSSSAQFYDFAQVFPERNKVKQDLTPITSLYGSAEDIKLVYLKEAHSSGGLVERLIIDTPERVAYAVYGVHHQYVSVIDKKANGAHLVLREIDKTNSHLDPPSSLSYSFSNLDGLKAFFNALF